jgi:cellobiose PTS system EIIA component
MAKNSTGRKIKNKNQLNSWHFYETCAAGIVSCVFWHDNCFSNNGGPMNIEQLTMKLIVESGTAKSKDMEAIESARNGEIQEAQRLHAESGKALTAAHEIQTDLIQEEADGAESSASMILVHAQDHLMSAMLVHDFAQEFINLYGKIGDIEKNRTAGGNLV